MPDNEESRGHSGAGPDPAPAPRRPPPPPPPGVAPSASPPRPPRPAVSPRAKAASSPGPRASRLARRRSRDRKRLSVVGLVIAGGVAVIAVVSIVTWLRAGDEDTPRRDRQVVTGRGEGSFSTLLVAGTEEPGGAATWLALLWLDPAGDKGAVMYVPAHTAVDVPGRGLQAVGDALLGASPDLLVTATNNLLGIEIDRYLELSSAEARPLMQAMSPLTVDVPAEVRAGAGPGQTRLVFTEGEQQLDGDALVDLLYLLGVDGDDVELGGRHLAFWGEVFSTYSGSSGALGDAFVSVAPLGRSDAEPREIADFLADMAALDVGDRTLTMLPVREVGVARGSLYSTDSEEVASFIEGALGAVPTPGGEVRVQVLNGNGVPGIGSEVDERLVEGGFRVVLSGNAQRLDHATTRVITYDRSQDGIAAAERASELLGVGEVQISAQQQGIVDLTIVVGRDFLRER